MLQKLHRFLGLVLLLPLFFIALTGIILVSFEVKNGWNLDSKSIGDSSQFVESLTYSFKNQHKSEVLERISFAGKVKIRASENGIRNNYIVSENLDFMLNESFLRKFAINIHDLRFIKNGRQIMGFIGVLALLLCVFGFFLYLYQKNLSGKLALKPRNTASFYRNFHAIIAFRLGLVIIFIIFAGVVIAFPKILPVNKPKMIEMFEDVRSLSDMTTFALKNIDKSSLYEVSFKNNSTIISVKKDSSILPYIFHFKDGKIMLDSPENYSTFTKFALSLPLIHKSKIGLVWSIMQILAGLLLILLSFAGFMLWFKKRLAKK